MEMDWTEYTTQANGDTFTPENFTGTEKVNKCCETKKPKLTDGSKLNLNAETKEFFDNIMCEGI